MNFGLNGVGSGLSFMRVLGSLSKTLGMVRQIAPLYKDLKPLFAKAPEFFSRISSLRNNIQNSRGLVASQIPTTLSSNNISSSIPIENNKGPVFFQ